MATKSSASVITTPLASIPNGTGLYDSMNNWLIQNKINNYNQLSNLDPATLQRAATYFNSISRTSQENLGMPHYFGGTIPSGNFNPEDVQKLLVNRLQTVKGVYANNRDITPITAQPNGYYIAPEQGINLNDALKSKGFSAISNTGSASSSPILVPQQYFSEMGGEKGLQNYLNPSFNPYEKKSDGGDINNGNGQLNDGGIQSGKGTAKSDSNPVVLPQGTVIIPVKNADKAIKIRKELGLSNKPFNNKDTSYDPKIWTSKGEVIFTPAEVELAKSKGHNLDEFIEGDGKGQEFSDGGEIDDKVLDEPNRTKLDGIVQEMIKNKEPEENIKFVVGDFKDKYGVKKKVSTESASISKESNSEVPSISTELKTPSPSTTPNIQEIAPFVSKLTPIKTVGQVKAEGGNPTFENYISSISHYPLENVEKIASGLKEAGKSYLALNLPKNKNTPVLDQLKQETGQALDTFKGLANAAFGVASLTPVGAAFNVVGDNLPDSWQKVAFQPATTLAKQFGYEPKEGDIGEKALSVADIVTSLALMKGAEIGGKKIIGKGEFAPSTEELNKAMYEGLGGKIKEGKPLNDDEIKIANNLIQTATPTDLSKAIAQNTDKVKPQFAEHDKVVNIIEKKKEGQDIKKDIAAFPDAKTFDNVLNISKEGGHIDDQTIDAIKKDYVDVQNAKAKVLPEHRDNPEIVGLVAEKTNLEESKKNVDDSFHPAIDAKIDAIKEQIDNITNPLKTNENALRKRSTTEILQRPQEGVGKTGGERGGVESIKQGIEPATQSEPTSPHNEGNIQKEEKILIPPENKVIIVRHAETIDDVQNKVSGQNDAALTPEGKKEADRAAKEIKDHGIEKIIASPLTRTKQTADIIAKEDNIPIEHSENLKAWDLGKFTESPEKDFNEEHYVNNPDEKIPGGESFNDFKDRIVAEYNKIAKESNGKVAVVTHSKNMKLWDALEKNDGKWNEKTKEYYLSEENGIKPAEVQVKGNEDVKREEFIKNKTKELQGLSDDEYVKQFIDQGHLNSINANRDFGMRPDFNLKTADVKKGINDIKNGKESAAARNLKESILDTKKTGLIPMIEGTGGMNDKYNFPLGYFHEEKPIKLTPQEEESHLIEYEDYYNSLSNEEKQQEYEHNTGTTTGTTEGGENQKGNNIKKTEKGKDEIPPNTPKAREKIEGEGEPKTTGIAHAVQEERATELGKESPQRGEGITAEEAIQKGKDLISEGTDANKVAEEFKKDGKISADALSIVRAKHEELTKDTNKAIDQFGENSKEAKEAFDKENTWYKDVVKPMQTEWHKIGMTQQGTIDIDTGSFIGLKRSFQQETGKDFTTKQTQEAKELSGKVKSLTDEVESLKNKLTNVIDNAIKESKFEDKTKNIKERAKKIADIIRKGKLSRPEYLSSASPISIVWDTALEIAAKTIETGGSIAQAIADGIEHIQSSSAYESFDKKDNIVKDFGRFIEQSQEEHDDIFTKFVDKKDDKFTPEEVKDIWNYAKKEYLDKDVTYGDMLSGVSKDLGLSTKQVREAISQPKGARVLTDEMYRKQNKRTMAVNAAKEWVKTTNTPRIIRFFKALPNVFFGLKVFGHGTVGGITHAGLNIFKPSGWKTYWPNFFKQFKFAFGNTAAYEKAMEDLQNDPKFIFWKRAGLAVDPLKIQDDYQTFSKYFGRLGVAGDRGFNALKTYRLDLAKSIYDGLSEVEKADPKTAKEIAKIVNHSTGSANIIIPQGLNVAFFAPRLEASRWTRLITQPIKAVTTFSNWNKASTSEKAAAKIVAKRSGEMLATYTALLAANQALLTASGSDQKINILFPTESDWMKFKAGDKTFDLTGGMRSTISFITRLMQASLENQKDLKGKSRWDLMKSSAGDYIAGKFSPFLSTLKDFVSQHNYNKDVMPFSNDKPTAGHTKLSWKDYILQSQTPIPISEAINDVERSMKEKGMKESQINDILNGIFVGLVSGGTGAKVGVSPKRNHKEDITPLKRHIFVTH